MIADFIFNKNASGTPAFGQDISNPVFLRLIAGKIKNCLFVSFFLYIFAAIIYLKIQELWNIQIFTNK